LESALGGVIRLHFPDKLPSICPASFRDRFHLSAIRPDETL
jgi:hypothetical protein